MLWINELLVIYIVSETCLCSLAPPKTKNLGFSSTQQQSPLGLLHFHHFSSLVYGSISSMIPMVVTDLESQSILTQNPQANRFFLTSLFKSQEPRGASQKCFLGWKWCVLWSLNLWFQDSPESRRTSPNQVWTPNFYLTRFCLGIFLFGMKPPLPSPPNRSCFLVPGDLPSERSEHAVCLMGVCGGKAAQSKSRQVKSKETNRTNMLSQHRLRTIW